MTVLPDVTYWDTDILSNASVVIETRVPVPTLFDYLKGGDTQRPSASPAQAAETLGMHASRNRFLQDMVPMTCKEIAEADISRKIAIMADEPRYYAQQPSPGGANPRVVRLRFDLDQGFAGNGTFVIRSNRVQRAVYFGPYRNDIDILAGIDLFGADEGYDNLEFLLLQPVPGRFCSWVEQVEHPFWTGTGTVMIRLMVERWEDEDGLQHVYAVDFVSD